MIEEIKADFLPAILESPFAHCEPLYLAYANAAQRYLMAVGYTPYASHLQLTRSLNDKIPAERELGMRAGIAMRNVLLKAGAQSFFFCDFGMSGGMRAALQGLLEGEYTSNYIGDDQVEVWSRIRDEAQFSDGAFADCLRKTAGKSMRLHLIAARDMYVEKYPRVV